MPVIHEITEENYIQEISSGRTTTVNKFKEIDKYKDRHLDSDGFKLLFDPTIWAYKFLKDKQNHPLRLRPFQDRIINDRSRFVFTAAANQIGKSWAGGVKALHHALHVPNASVLIGSRNQTQAINFLDEIKNMMRRSGIDFEQIIDEVENRTEFHITNTDGKGVSKLISLAPTHGALGYPATLELLDEISFWENGPDIYDQVFEPRTNETKNWVNTYFTMGQIFSISNPNGQQGLGWKLWKDPRYNTYRYCWLANPSNTWEEYQAAKKRLPTDKFDSIYGANFSSATGGFITQTEYNDAIKNPYEMIIPMTTLFYLGGDFAGEDTTSRDVDNTVLYGTVQTLDEQGRTGVKVVYWNEFPIRTKKNVTYAEIDRLNKTYQLPMFAYDRMGVGDSVKNDLIDKRILTENQIETLTYSLPNKSEIYYNLKHLYEQRLIQHPHIPQLQEQLTGLRFTQTQAGHLGRTTIKIHHAKESIHDDHPDALANACWAATRLTNPVVTLNRVEYGFTKKKPVQHIASTLGERLKEANRKSAAEANNH